MTNVYKKAIFSLVLLVSGNSMMQASFAHCFRTIAACATAGYAATVYGAVEGAKVSVELAKIQVNEPLLNKASRATSATVEVVKPVLGCALGNTVLLGCAAPVGLYDLTNKIIERCQLITCGRYDTYWPLLRYSDPNMKYFIAASTALWATGACLAYGKRNAIKGYALKMKNCFAATKPVDQK